MVVVGPLCYSEGQEQDVGGRTRGDTRILRQERRCFVAVFVPDHADPNNATPMTSGKLHPCQWCVADWGKGARDRRAKQPTGPEQRHPRIAALFVAHLSGQPHTPFLRAASEATFHLVGAGFEAPTSDALAHGARPGPLEPEEIELAGLTRRTL